MPARVLPTLWPGASPEEIAQALNNLSTLLSELLMVSERGGLDRTNIKRRGVHLGTGTGVAGNLDGVYVSYTSNAMPNTEDTVTHNLGRVPIGFLVIERNKAGTVYSSSKASWSSTKMYLKCDVGDTATTLLVF
jgi:hypothetical protein